MAGSGLEGVVVAETRLSRVDGEAGTLTYAGYSIEELAEHATFEEVCHLLWHGSLPDRTELADLEHQLSGAYALPDPVASLIREAPATAHPMAVLRSAVSLLGMHDPEAEDMSREANLRKAIRLTASLPTITATTGRSRAGQEPVEPRPDLSLAGNLLYMLTGQEPDARQTRTMDVALTLHADHGFNASTFAARVTIATLADLYSAVTSAIGTLKGPLHGGANERVMWMLEEIGTAENAESWVRDALARKEKVMGFGHRVYRAIDPRAPILRRLGDGLGSSRWFDVSDRVREVMREEMDRHGKKVYANVDFYSASVYERLGVPTELFTNIFACARVAGWTAHILEQLEDNRLIRPKAKYIGPENLSVTPLEQRSGRHHG
jgi:citrate synthase